MTDTGRAVVVGGGPAGLMAAEVLASGGATVHLYDGMPSVGRKFLLAGKGGLNLTHAEAFEPFVARYGARAPEVEVLLRQFTPQQLRDWAAALGVDTFVGSSGRVFPRDLKAAPLLRAWLHRLRGRGVKFHMRQRWSGWAAPLDSSAPQGLHFESPCGASTAPADVVLLALGGGSWSRLGSDGAWVPRLLQHGVDVAPLRAANCGFEVTGRAQGAPGGWSEHFCSRFAGHALKSVAIELRDVHGEVWRQPGEFVVSAYGVEGSLVYAASARLRDELQATGGATLYLDLLPARSREWVAAELAHPRASRSLSTHLKSRLGLAGVKAGLLHELLDKATLADAERLAAMIKALPLCLRAPRPIDEAISSAGGVRFEAMDERLMLKAMPGVFCAGEMLDWEAPTGGYLLSACFASGRVAGQGALAWLARRVPA
ncbi:MAG TPA: TIGR03862 family flavoprotein [Rubrivivax sp.]|nr:TIGR03862 family flavoprotein [Rubrivivax sp.]